MGKACYLGGDFKSGISVREIERVAVQEKPIQISV